ncbi:MAG TPA: DinB family protein [Planctomycetota bacterium]|nr:DinB family protein [Planctomycetota bacterium]
MTEPAVFASRAVRSIVELHEQEWRRFFETWDRFIAAGAPMPDARGDADYQSPDHLVGHVARAARNYLTWIGEQLGRPVKDVDLEKDSLKIAPRVREFVAEVLAAWRRHLPAVEDADLEPATYKSRWGTPMSIEAMLEHAVVHPMRHRIQLERILKQSADSDQPSA